MGRGWTRSARRGCRRSRPDLLTGLAPLLPELSDEHPGLEDTTRLYDAVVALLRHLARRYSLLLTIDDVHWLDERSVALLHYTARNLRGSVPLLVSSRPRELTDNLSVPAHARCAAPRRRGRRPPGRPAARRRRPGADPAGGTARRPEPDRARQQRQPPAGARRARAVVRGDDPLSGRWTR